MPARRHRSPSGEPILSPALIPTHDDLDHLPDNHAVILLCGPIGAGKTTLATTRWPEAHIDVSRIREQFGSTADEETLRPAFSSAYRQTEQRLSRGLLAVFDSTAVTPRVRANIQWIARRYRAAAHVVIVDTPLELAVERNLGRDLPIPPDAVKRNHTAFTEARTAVQSEQWASITFLATTAVPA